MVKKVMIRLIVVRLRMIVLIIKIIIYLKAPTFLVSFLIMLRMKKMKQVSRMMVRKS